MTKKLEIGNSKIEVFFEEDKEKIKTNLIKLYDTINLLADKFNRKGIDTSSWFLSQQDIEKMKQENKYTFL